MSIQIQEPLVRLAIDSGLFERVYVGPVTHTDFDWQTTLTHIPLHLESTIADLRQRPYLQVPPNAALRPPPGCRRVSRSPARVGLRWYGRAQYHNAKRSAV